MGSPEWANLSDTQGDLGNCVELIGECLKGTLGLCETSSGMYRGRDKNGEKESMGMG